MKKAKKLTFILFVILLIIVLSILLIKEPTIEIADRRVDYFNGNYVVMENDRICFVYDKNIEPICKVNNCYSLFIKENNMYLVNYEDNNINPVINILDETGKVIKSTHLTLKQHLPDNIKNYKNYISIKAIIDDFIFVLDEYDGECHIFDMNNDFTEQTIEFHDIYDVDSQRKCGIYKDYVFIYYYENNKLKIDTIIDTDNNVSYPVLSQNSQNYFNGIIYEYDSYRLMDLRLYDIYSHKYQEYKDFFEKSSVFINRVTGSSKGDDFLIITNSNSLVDSGDDFKEHDVICRINTASLCITSEYKTKIKERILYADAEKAITYYKNNYLTYSLDNWEKIKSQQAKEIKPGGSYTFETFNNYIFVFDDNSDKLINIIDIT